MRSSDSPAAVDHQDVGVERNVARPHRLVELTPKAEPCISHSDLYEAKKDMPPRPVKDARLGP